MKSAVPTSMATPLSVFQINHYIGTVIARFKHQSHENNLLLLCPKMLNLSKTCYIETSYAPVNL